MNHVFEAIYNFLGTACVFLKTLIPVRGEAILGATAGAAGTVASHFCGAWNNLTEILVMMMVIDYLSGVIAAFINPDLAANSKKGFIGIARKVFIWLIVVMANDLDLAMNTHEICTMATFFYIANEGLSITENAAKVGVPIPAFIRNSLEQISHEKKAREKSEGK